jgi:hypothetical protein
MVAVSTVGGVGAAKTGTLSNETAATEEAAMERTNVRRGNLIIGNLWRNLWARDIFYFQCVLGTLRETELGSANEDCKSGTAVT